jgi:hypothetical protein
MLLMLKLYKEIDGQLQYWETWETWGREEESAIIHYGVVGQRGVDYEIKSDDSKNFKEKVQFEIEQKLSEGFKEIDDKQMAKFDIQIPIDTFFANDEALKKRYKLYKRLDQLMGWTGLGHADGEGSGMGMMDVGCVVVDYEIAKNVIEQDLKGVELYSNYKFVKLGG